RMKRRTPCATQWSNRCARNGRPATGAIGLGKSGTALRSRVPSPPARTIAVVMSASHRVDQAADRIDLVVTQVGEVADVEAVEVHVLAVRKPQVVVGRHDAAQVRLAQLVAATGAAAAELDARLAHRG